MRLVLALLLAALVAAAAILVLTSEGERGDVEPADGIREAPTAPGAGPPVLVGQGEARAPTADAGLGDATLVGRVVDESGAPVADVRVEVRPRVQDPWRSQGWQNACFAPPREPPAPIAVDVTDAEGRFEVRGLPHGESVDVVPVPSPPRAGLGRFLSIEGEARVPITLVVLDGAAVRGRLVDGDGRGLAGWIYAHLPVDDPREGLGDASWAPYPTATDGGGAFLLPSVPRGTVHLDAWVFGRGSVQCVPVEVPGGEVELRLFDSRDVRVVGTVSTADGRRVAGVRVRTEIQRADDSGYAVGLATTAPDGSYAIHGLPDGSLGFVEAAYDSHKARHEPEEREPVAPGQTVRCDLVLDARATVRGHVRTEAGDPVAGVLVGGFAGKYGLHWTNARTDAEGRYTIEGLELGRLALRIGGTQWFDPQAWPLGRYTSDAHPGLVLEVERDGQVLVADLVVRQGVTVRGHVVDDRGRAVAGARVCARCDGLHPGLQGDPWPSVTTGEGGTFAFESLRPAVAWRFDAAFGDARAVPLTPIRVVPGETVGDLVLELSAAASLSGRVVDTDGVPQAGYEVELEEEDVETETDARGAFSFSRLYAGTHTIRLRSGDPHSYLLPAQEVSVELAPGEARTDLVVTTRDTLAAAGTVVDDQGKPVAHAMVDLHRIGAGRFPSTMTRTDEQGRFRCPGLPPGRYRASIDGVPLEGEIEAGAEDVRLVLEREETWKLSGRVVGPDGSVVGRARVEVSSLPGLSRRYRTEADVTAGAFEVFVPEGIPAVIVKVRDAEGEDGAALAVVDWERVNVTPDDGPLEILLEAARGLAGRVVDPAGNPVPGVAVYVSDSPNASYRPLLATTDLEGRFRASGRPRASVWLRFLPPSGWGAPDDLLVASDDTDLSVVLEASTPFEGRVVDEEGRGVPDALVILTEGASEGGVDVEFEPAYEHLPRTLTDRQGRFRITTVRKGTYDVTVGASERRDDESWPYLPRVLEDVPTPETPIRIELVRGVFIEAEVYEADGTPAAGCRVSGWPDARSGLGRFRDVTMTPVAEGSHRHRSCALAPGTYYLRAARGDQDLETPTVRVKAPATGVRLQFEPHLEIRGRIEGARGERYDLRFVAGDRSGLEVSGRSLPDGSFLLAAPRAVSGVLYAQVERGDRYALQEAVVPGRGPCILRSEKGLRIQGRLPDGDRAGSGHVLVSGPHGIAWRAYLDDEGAFEVRALPPGRYDIEVWCGRDRTYECRGVAAGSRDVILTPVVR